MIETLGLITSIYGVFAVIIFSVIYVIEVQLGKSSITLFWFFCIYIYLFDSFLNLCDSRLQQRELEQYLVIWVEYIMMRRNVNVQLLSFGGEI